MAEGETPAELAAAGIAAREFGNVPLAAWVAAGASRFGAEALAMGRGELAVLYYTAAMVAGVGTAHGAMAQVLRGIALLSMGLDEAAARDFLDVLDGRVTDRVSIEAVPDGMVTHTLAGSAGRTPANGSIKQLMTAVKSGAIDAARLRSPGSACVIAGIDVDSYTVPASWGWRDRTPSENLDLAMAAVRVENPVLAIPYFRKALPGATYELAAEILYQRGLTLWRLAKRLPPLAGQLLVASARDYMDVILVETASVKARRFNGIRERNYRDLAWDAATALGQLSPEVLESAIQLPIGGGTAWCDGIVGLPRDSAELAYMERDPDRWAMAVAGDIDLDPLAMAELANATGDNLTAVRHLNQRALPRDYSAAAAEARVRRAYLLSTLRSPDTDVVRAWRVAAARDCLDVIEWPDQDVVTPFAVSRHFTPKAQAERGLRLVSQDVLDEAKRLPFGGSGPYLATKDLPRDAAQMEQTLNPRVLARLESADRNRVLTGPGLNPQDVEKLHRDLGSWGGGGPAHFERPLEAVLQSLAEECDAQSIEEVLGLARSYPSADVVQGPLTTLRGRLQRGEIRRTDLQGPIVKWLRGLGPLVLTL